MKNHNCLKVARIDKKLFQLENAEKIFDFSQSVKTNLYFNMKKLAILLIYRLSRRRGG